MAHKKAGGSSRNGRDSQSKRLGVKVYGGEVIRAGFFVCHAFFLLSRYPTIASIESSV